MSGLDRSGSISTSSLKSTSLDFQIGWVVTPGLTGYAQVNGGYELEPEEKIVYDMEYIEKRSVLMDIKCLAKTVSLIFTHEGAR